MKNILCINIYIKNCSVNINNMFSRLFAKIIYNKLQENSKHIIREGQNVSNPGLDYVDNLLIVYYV